MHIDLIFENLFFFLIFDKKLLIIIGIVKGVNRYEYKFGFFKFQKLGFLKFILFVSNDQFLLSLDLISFFL